MRCSNDVVPTTHERSTYCAPAEDAKKKSAVQFELAPKIPSKIRRITLRKDSPCSSLGFKSGIYATTLSHGQFVMFNRFIQIVSMQFQSRKHVLPGGNIVPEKLMELHAYVLNKAIEHHEFPTRAGRCVNSRFEPQGTARRILPQSNSSNLGGYFEREFGLHGGLFLCISSGRAVS